MATAPTPGVSTRDDEARAAKQIIVLRIKERTVRLNVNNMSFQERAIFRKATGGIPISAYVESTLALDVDSLMAIWWAGRRAEGEFQLTLTRVEREWREAKWIGEEQSSFEEGDVECYMDDGLPPTAEEAEIAQALGDLEEAGDDPNA